MRFVELLQAMSDDSEAGRRCAAVVLWHTPEPDASATAGTSRCQRLERGDERWCAVDWGVF